MKTLPLTGYLPDRDNAMVARMLTDAGYDMAADWGLVVTDTTAEAEDACPDEALALVASRFGPPAVPRIVSMSQARRALHESGVSAADVDAAIATIFDPAQRERARIQWEYDTMVRRDNALVQAIGPALGLDLNAIFLAASRYD